jgi:valyl-tRNA synthetase
VDQALPRGAVVSERFELARNFSNKLWNVSRLVLIHLEGYEPAPVADEQLAFEDRWILSRLATVTSEVTRQLEQYGYAEAARQLYDFAWDEFCSVYAEMAKPRFDDPASRPVAQRVMAHALDQLLRLLHPMMPFLTEEVWYRLGQVAPLRGLNELSAPSESLVIAPWPTADLARYDQQLEQQFAQFRAVLGALREIRSRQGIAPKDSIEFCLACDPATARLLEPMQRFFQSMARATGTAWGPSVTPPATHAQVSLKGIEVYVDLSDLLDVEAEIERNSRQEQKLRDLIAAKENKLANAGFVQRAPAEVVQRERESLAELQQQLTATREALGRLQRLGS